MRFALSVFVKNNILLYNNKMKKRNQTRSMAYPAFFSGVIAVMTIIVLMAAFQENIASVTASLLANLFGVNF